MCSNIKPAIRVQSYIIMVALGDPLLALINLIRNKERDGQIIAIEALLP